MSTTKLKRIYDVLIDPKTKEKTYYCLNCGTPGEEPFEECGICGLTLKEAQGYKKSNLADITCPKCKGHLIPKPKRICFAECSRCNYAFDLHDILGAWFTQRAITHEYCKKVFKEIAMDIYRKIAKEQDTDTKKKALDYIKEFTK